jgi:hypothetical protein
MASIDEGKHIHPTIDDSANTNTPIDELYWKAIGQLTLPESRHFATTDDLEQTIWLQFLHKKMVTLPLTLTLQHEAVLVRIRETWAKADYGFTFGPVAPAARQPPPPPPGTSPNTAAILEHDWRFLADVEAHLPTSFAKYRTLDDVRIEDKRKMVVATQNILPDESVARCMEALFRKKDVPEAITWLGQTAKK